MGAREPPFASVARAARKRAARSLLRPRHVHCSARARVIHHRNPRYAAPLALILATSLALGGCYSSAVITKAGLAPLHAGDQSEGGVVYTAKREAVKLDPNSEIRFERVDGTFSPWLAVRDLYVSDDGVFTLRHAAPSELHAATVTGLTPEQIATFEDLRPDYASLERTGADAVFLQGDGKGLIGWMKAIRASLGDVPGAWTFHLTPDVGPFSGSALAGVEKQGVRVVDGLRWDDIASAEVNNLNHGTTAVAVVAVTAAVIGIVTVIALSKGKLNIPLPKLGAAPIRVAQGVGRGALHVTRGVARGLGRVQINGGGSSGSGSGSSGGSSAPSESVASNGSGSSESSESEAPPSPGAGGETATLGNPEYAPVNADRAQPLFDGGARRQSIVRLVGTFDVERDVSAEARNHLSLAAALRLYDFVEIGAGVRWLSSIPSADGASRRSDLVVFGRLGINAEIDAHRRFAFPFAIDFGAGGDVTAYAKLVFGLRVRLSERWALGVYAFNPTLVHYRESSGLPERTRWSFPSGVEATFAF